MLLVQCRESMSILPVVTAVLFHHIDMDSGNNCSVVSTG